MELVSRYRELIIGLLMFALVSIFYIIWSYGLTDPNLVFTTWQPYWQAQLWLWQTLFDNSQRATYVYVALGTILWAVYGYLLWLTTTKYKQQRMDKGAWVLVLGSSLPLVLAYNALSHDIFNYLFNAKMVLVYGADPHVTNALEFAFDPWVRFMHNTHTAAPYGYGWTILSLVPYTLGLGKFSLTWIVFKLWSWISVLTLAAVLAWFSGLVRKRQLLVAEAVALFLNPLFVVEVVGNGHNDLWMMIPAVIAVGLVTAYGTKRLSLALAALLGSISIKYATLALIPVVVGLIYADYWWVWLRSRLRFRILFMLGQGLFKRLFGWVVREQTASLIATISSVLLLLLLLSPRSQQFHPWYLSWVLVWLPFINFRGWKVAVLALSISSFFRYVPWLWRGEYTDDIILAQKLVTWLGAIVLLGAWYAYRTRQMQSRSVMKI